MLHGEWSLDVVIVLHLYNIEGYHWDSFLTHHGLSNAVGRADDEWDHICCPFVWVQVDCHEGIRVIDDCLT